MALVLSAMENDKILITHEGEEMWFIVRKNTHKAAYSYDYEIVLQAPKSFKIKATHEDKDKE